MSDTRPPMLDWPFFSKSSDSHHVKIAQFKISTFSHTAAFLDWSLTQTGRMSSHQPVENICSCMSEMLTVKQMHGKVEFIGYSELLQGMLATHLIYTLTDVAADVRAGNSFGYFKERKQRTSAYSVYWHVFYSAHFLCFLSFFCLILMLTLAISLLSMHSVIFLPLAVL